MTNSRKAGQARRPAIHMIDRESEIITALAEKLEKQNPSVAELLYSELDRAVLCGADRLPPNTVTMNCTVEFVDERSGARRSVKLVYPQEADISENRISILTPIGAGLIGMRAGSSIAWPDRSGAKRVLKIVNVVRPAISPERENDAA